jgi:hypothetical protein
VTPSHTTGPPPPTLPTPESPDRRSTLPRSPRPGRLRSARQPRRGATVGWPPRRTAPSMTEQRSRASWPDCCNRTIWAALQPRAARPLWCESGGRAGVSELGGGEQPTAEASAASTSGSPSARTRNVAFALAGPAMPDGTKRLKDTLGLTPERVSGVPPRGLEMCLAQADSTLMTRFSGIAVVDGQHAVARRREP